MSTEPSHIFLSPPPLRGCYDFEIPAWRCFAIPQLMQFVIHPKLKLAIFPLKSNTMFCDPPIYMHLKTPSSSEGGVILCPPTIFAIPHS